MAPRKRARQNGPTASPSMMKSRYGNTGWIPLEPQEQRQLPHPYQGHGNWQGLSVLQPHQYQGWAFTLDATPSTYDTRSQLWVFGLCVHTLRTGQLQRLGAITGIPTNPQTKARALVAGLAALAQHTSTPVKVIVQLATVWEVWTQPKHRQAYQDLLHPLKDEDFHRVTVLYISKNTRTPDMPGNEPHLQRRQRDAALTAWLSPDHKAIEWQAVLDQDHEEIYRHAAARLALVFADKQHYLHQKAPRHQAHQTKQHKKQLVQQCRKPWQAPLHRWQPHRSGYQCSACGERVHQGLTASNIEDKLTQDCSELKKNIQCFTARASPSRRRSPEPSSLPVCWTNKLLTNQRANTTWRKRRDTSDA